VVKIYHDNHGLKLNDVVELYAILTYDPTAAITDIAGDAGEGAATTMMTAADFMDAEFLRAQPSSNIPRLHCLSWTHLTPINANPLFRRAPSPWTDHSRTIVHPKRRAITCMECSWPAVPRAS